VSKLRISDSLSLPLDATTQAIAWLGRRGSGKSYGATKLAELLFDQGAQFVAIDPVGIWYGLRLDKDGKSKGIDIPIFGGLHGDIPLEAGGGALIADVIVGRNISAVLDVSQFEHDSDKAKFAAAFADRFFFLKKSSPSAVHVFVEEAQEFIPQNIQKGEEKMLHAWQRMIRLGRNYGIGVSMISQRPQDVNKKALNQSECIFCFQLTGPQERKAVEGWISEHGLEEDLQQVLPRLQQGHAHVWSPVWLDFNSEVHIAEKRTFAAGSTPKVGAKPVKIVSLEPMELEQLSKEMAATIERQKENDPMALKKKIAQLQRELQQKHSSAPVKTHEVKVVDQKAIQSALKKRDQEWARAVRDYQKKTADAVAVALKGVNTAGLLPVETTVDYTPEVRQPRPQPVRPPVRQHVPRAESNGNGDLRLRPGAQRMLAACASWAPKGISEGQVAAMSGIKRSGGSFSSYKSNLVTAGFIQIQNGLWYATDEGITHAGDTIAPAPSSTEEVLNLWKPKLRPGAQRMLDVLIAHNGEPITAEQLSEESDVDSSGGSFSSYLSNLATADLIVKPERGMVAANVETLFL
jgi:hypothetical protein